MFDFSQLTRQLIRQAVYPLDDLLPVVEDGRRHAAVLMPLIRVGDDWQVLFIKKPAYSRNHQGQIAFPGGRYEPGDETIIDTMYREVFEEIGVPREEIELLGHLDLQYTTSSKFSIVPFIGVLQTHEKCILSCDEVEKIVLIPLTWLSNSQNVVEEWMEDELAQPVLTFRYYEYAGEILWGATARMAQNFISLINRIAE